MVLPIRLLLSQDLPTHAINHVLILLGILVKRIPFAHVSFRLFVCFIPRHRLPLRVVSSATVANVDTPSPASTSDALSRSSAESHGTSPHRTVGSTEGVSHLPQPATPATPADADCSNYAGRPRPCRLVQRRRVTDGPIFVLSPPPTLRHRPSLRRPWRHCHGFIVRQYHRACSPWESAGTPPYGTDAPRPHHRHARTPIGSPRDARTPAKPETVSGIDRPPQSRRSRTLVAGAKGIPGRQGSTREGPGTPLRHGRVRGFPENTP